MLCCTARCAGRVICTISLYLCACLPPVENKPSTVHVCTINRSSLEVFLTLWVNSQKCFMHLGENIH